MDIVHILQVLTERIRLLNSKILWCQRILSQKLNTVNTDVNGTICFCTKLKDNVDRFFRGGINQGGINPRYCGKWRLAGGLILDWIIRIKRCVSIDHSTTTACFCFTWAVPSRRTSWWCSWLRSGCSTPVRGWACAPCKQLGKRLTDVLSSKQKYVLRNLL